jgi:hypothetical protein
MKFVLMTCGEERVAYQDEHAQEDYPEDETPRD